MSTKRAPRRVFTGDRRIDDAQQNGRDATRRANAAIFDGGVLLDADPGQPAGSGLAFSAGTPRSFAHGLGRAARGWIEVYSANIVSASHVGLRASAQPAGLTSATHVTVTPASSGVCLLFVF